MAFIQKPIVFLQHDIKKQKILPVNKFVEVNVENKRVFLFKQRAPIAQQKLSAARIGELLFLSWDRQNFHKTLFALNIKEGKGVFLSASYWI